MSSDDRPSEADVDTLFRRYARSRRRRDRNALVEAHTGFAYHIANRFRSRGLADEDIRQVALLALVKAIDRFDPDHGAAFTSFAGRTIEGEIKRHFRDTAWSVRVPRSTKELHLSVRRAGDELTHTLGRPPTTREIASHLEIDTDDVIAALSASAAFTPASLDRPTDDDRGADRDATLAIGDDLDAADDRLLVERLISTLPAREQEIVRLRFYEELTQSEIADRVGMSQMHVSRLLRRSFEDMRAAAR
jgi:RNA polymerase sigma-B factor